MDVTTPGLVWLVLIFVILRLPHVPSWGRGLALRWLLNARCVPAAGRTGNTAVPMRIGDLGDAVGRARRRTNRGSLRRVSDIGGVTRITTGGPPVRLSARLCERAPAVYVVARSLVRGRERPE